MEGIYYVDHDNPISNDDLISSSPGEILLLKEKLDLETKEHWVENLPVLESFEKDNLSFSYTEDIKPLGKRLSSEKSRIIADAIDHRRIKHLLIYSHYSHNRDKYYYSQIEETEGAIPVTENTREGIVALFETNRGKVTTILEKGSKITLSQITEGLSKKEKQTAIDKS